MRKTSQDSPAGGEPKGRRRGPVPSLTMRAITSAGVDIADADGLAAVTMRRLADTLGVSAAGLYRYVTSRDVLLDEMVDAMAASLAHPTPSGDWLADLIDAAHQQRAMYVTHPWLVSAIRHVNVLGPNTLDHFEWGLAVLTDVPATVTRKLETLALANGLAALFASPAAGGTGNAETLSRLSTSRHPRLARDLATAPADGDDRLFERALTSLLGGLLGAAPRLEQVADTRPEPPPFTGPREPPAIAASATPSTL